MTMVLRQAPGFDDPAMDSQAVFRAILDAMSRPGRKVANPVKCHPPAPLTPATAAIALCLLDPEVSVWFDEAISPAADFLRFHTNARRCNEPRDATFAVIGAPETMPRFSEFNAGTALYPERSTTLIIQTETLDDSAPVLLTGPGIEHRQSIAPSGLPDWFWNDWAVNGSQFPVGIDVLMTDPRYFLGLPRTTLRCDP
ncbi:phosphonate C-P lyase system protein PhnH [Microbacteriaceae bacterium K1510]|nr:phosphonate C-P lyase system protein PhnH [Microbacteriaceae bacterium K1510]